MSKEKSKEIIEISPKKLYPMISFVEISPYRLEEAKSNLINNKDIVIKAIEFEGDMYILEGHHVMLAANILEYGSIKVQVINCTKELNIWANKESIKEQISSISVSTLYDFEGVGNFKYERYPKCYRR